MAKFQVKTNILTGTKKRCGKCRFIVQGPKETKYKGIIFPKCVMFNIILDIEIPVKSNIGFVRRCEQCLQAEKESKNGKI